MAALLAWRRRPAVAGDVVAPAAESAGNDVAERGVGGRKVRPSIVVSALLVAASLFIGVTMLLGDHEMLTSFHDLAWQPKVSTAKEANVLLPYWAESAAGVATGYQWESNFTNSGAEPIKEALSWDRTAVSRFPSDPALAADIATLDLQLGDRRAAQAEDLHALRLDPWTYLALETLGTIAKDDHDYGTSLYFYRQAQKVAPAANDLANLIKSDEAKLHTS